MSKTKINTPTPTRSKRDQLIGLLKRDSGATLEEMTSLTGWLPHTVRAAMTGLKKTGLIVTREKVDGVSRYSITGDVA
jgi:predicted ArsR family transcriptional regulator